MSNLRAIGNAETTMHVKPGFLLVERLPERERVSSGGIVLPDLSKDFVSSALTSADDECLLVVGGVFGQYGAGSVVYLAKHRVRWMSVFPLTGYEPKTLGIIDGQAIEIGFESEEQAERFRSSARA